MTAAHHRRCLHNPTNEVTYLVDRNINYTNVCISLWTINIRTPGSKVQSGFYGQNATQFSSVYNPPLTDLWFSGETLFLDWFDTGLPGNERLTLTVGKTTVGHGLW